MNVNINERGVNMFWENYHRAFDWQNSNSIAHLRARARALEVENTLLRDFIDREIHQRHSIPSNSQHYGAFGEQCKENVQLLPTNTNKEDADEIDSNTDDEISEELLAFYEKTIRHKIERKKKQKEDRNAESDDSQRGDEKISFMGPITSVQKSRDMAELYGDESPKILSMELSMQINFDMNRCNSHAQFWPNIPLRLS